MVWAVLEVPLRSRTGVYSRESDTRPLRSSINPTHAYDDHGLFTVMS